MAARRSFGDARDEVVQEYSNIVSFDKDALHELLELMGPEEDISRAFNERFHEVQAARPDLAYKFHFSQDRVEDPLPSWDEFVTIWGSVIDWDHAFDIISRRARKYTVRDIVQRNYKKDAFYGPPIAAPAARSGSLTKPARRSSAQIQRALRTANGDHAAAARLLLK